MSARIARAARRANEERPRSRGPSTWKRYAAFLRHPPELTVQWQDRETGARAWLIINSSRGGAAGGGTRMHLGVHPREVTYLAKTMELKFSIAGPPIGGAKSGIDFDPEDPRKAGVLERWYRAITPFLRARYGTGGDFGVDEVLDVIPTFERLGLAAPQEGVVRGHLAPTPAGFDAIMRRMEQGVAAPIEVAGLEGYPMTVADVVTGYGVGYAVQHHCERGGNPLEGKRVLIEGFGNVGAACALYLAHRGARIVGVCDSRATLLAPDGLSATDVEELVRRRDDKRLPLDDGRVRPGMDLAFWDVPADVFVAAALSETVTEEIMDRLDTAGVRIIAAGANQPFREARLGSTAVARLADYRFAVLPDILANCGMARTFSYLMEGDARAEAEPVLAAVERTIRDTLDEVLERAGSGEQGLLAATLGLALDRVGRD